MLKIPKMGILKTCSHELQLRGKSQLKACVDVARAMQHSDNVNAVG